MLLEKYEKFKENKEIREIAWLYFLHIVYNGELSIKSWCKDNRMGVNCHDTMIKLEKIGLVVIEKEIYKSDKKAFNEIMKYFGSNTLEESFNKSIELLHYKKDDNDYKGYSINEIPIDLWFKINENESDVIDNYREIFFTSWWNNNGNDIIIKRWLKNNSLKDRELINEYNIRSYYYPKKMPEYLTLYRGLKNEYKDNHTKKYTSWTLDLEQGKRFAKYHFSKGYTSTPNESEIQILLETKVKIKDIIVFIGGEEHEVVLKEPVKINKITKL